MSQKTQQEEQSTQLPNEIYMGFVFPNATIDALKKARLLSKAHKQMAEREIMKRYKNFIRADDLFAKEYAGSRSLPQIMLYLTRIENNIINPAMAAGPNGSPAQIAFLSTLLFEFHPLEYHRNVEAYDRVSHKFATDYPTFRYLLERGANPNTRPTRGTKTIADMLISFFKEVHPQNDWETDERTAIFTLAIRYGMTIDNEYNKAKEILQRANEYFPEKLPLNMRDPSEWPSMFEEDDLAFLENAPAAQAWLNNMFQVFDAQAAIAAGQNPFLEPLPVAPSN